MVQVNLPIDDETVPFWIDHGSMLLVTSGHAAVINKKVTQTAPEFKPALVLLHCSLESKQPVPSLVARTCYAFLDSKS